MDPFSIRPAPSRFPGLTAGALTSTTALLVLLLLLPSPVFGQEGVLGHTEFPHSGPEEAHAPFLEGVLWLHSFEYDRAREAFLVAQKRAPDFALAYWGEAMTWNHPVWFAQYPDEAREVMQRLGPSPEARLARGGTERERAWLETLEILYGEGPKAQRDTLYSEALGRMWDRWPDDENVGAFYALSILGTSHGGRDIPTYMRAAAVAEEIYERNPDHPGVLHYLIHAYDDPVHAPLGLRAARRYARIAGDAPHAQHMTTHIFVAMGMWDEVVAHNEVASGPDRDLWRPGHYTWWLGYGYLQQGRWREAEAHLEAMRSSTGAEAPPGMRVARLTVARMRAELAANTRRWDHPALAWDIRTEDVRYGFGSAVVAADDWVQGRAALERGDPQGALARAEALARRRSEAEARGDPNDPTPGVARVMELQLRGLAARASGRSQDGVALLREALELERSLPFEFGPPLVVIPSGELLGEVLLAEDRAAEAERSFRMTLEVAPGRWTALEGLARAQEALGDEAAAKRTWQELSRHWHRADPELSRTVQAGSEGR
jgi:tetratricopeptide (TPR) repeat protein